MRIAAAGLSDIGRKRSQNQDRFTVDTDLGLFLVADGMGGHKGGETASRIVSEVVPEQVKKARKKKGFDPAHALTEAIRAANLEIYKTAQKDTALQGMGTTTTALLVEEKRVVLGHVGDSRCYFVRQGALWQATRDHSLVQEKLRAGLITRQELKTDRMKNVITRSVGFDGDVTVETYGLDAAKGDCFILCSDGLSGMIEDAAILKIVGTLSDGQQALAGGCKALIDAANLAGGDDNVTAVLVRVES